MRHLRLVSIIILLTILLSGCVQKIEQYNHPDLYPAFEIIDNKKVWGFINSKGKFVIEPAYSEVSDFSEEGLAIFNIGNAYGVLNSKGEEIIPASFQFISDFTSDFIFAFDGKSNHVYNLKGEEQFFTDEYLYMGNFSDGLFPAAKLDDEGNLKFGYLDKTGKVIIEPKYKEAWPFNNGNGLVKVEDNKYEIIDTEGNTITELPYYVVIQSEDSELYFFVEEKEGKIGLLDIEGNIHLEPKFTKITKVSDGNIVFLEKKDETDLYGISDFDGNIIFEPKYSNIKPLGKGYFAIGNDENKFALANDKGEIITDFIYDDLGSNVEITSDKIPAFDGQRTYLIDFNGKQSNEMPEIPGRADVVYNGHVSKVNSNGRISYYNSGNLIWEEENYFILNENAKVTEESYTNDEGVNIKYPVVEGLKNKDVENSINNELYKLFVEEKLEEAKSNDYAYYNTIYSVNNINDLLIIDSLSDYMYEADIYPIKESKIYNISLNKGTFFKFEDLFKEGSAYQETISDIVMGMMEQQTMQGMGFYDISQWEGIKPDQSFIPKMNTIDIFVNPEELNSFSGTIPKFTIKQEQISEILDMNAEIWWTLLAPRGF